MTVGSPCQIRLNHDLPQFVIEHLVKSSQFCDFVLFVYVTKERKNYICDPPTRTITVSEYFY